MPKKSAFNTLKEAGLLEAVHVRQDFFGAVQIVEGIAALAIELPDVPIVLMKDAKEVMRCVNNTFYQPEGG